MPVGVVVADRSVHLLVNDAGFGTTGRFVDLPVEGEDQEIRLDVLALTRLAEAALRPMVAAGRGAVVDVGSVASFSAPPDDAVDAATKADVPSFTEALAVELRGTGLRAQCLCPGLTRTELQETASSGTSSTPAGSSPSPACTTDRGRRHPARAVLGASSHLWRGSARRERSR